MKVMIDPPGGHAYGFPKACSAKELDDPSFDLNRWLLTNGYPQSGIDELQGRVPCWIRRESQKAVLKD